MKILIIGNGGREHALAWKVAQSSKVSQVFVAPGNAGTAHENKTQNVDIAATDVSALINFCQKNPIDLAIVGAEAPLALGIVDQFQEAGLACFGPTQAAAQLESSKEFAKDFMIKHNIPTAHYLSFSDPKAAKEYVATQSMPTVIKADGLAAGKGVVIAQNQKEAEHTIDAMLSGNQFNEAGHRIVIEEFLTGEEASFIAICDGETAIPLVTSQDHKARDDGDKGPNTGGMGAYSPAPVVTEDLEKRIMQMVIQPVIDGMKAQGTPFVGFLYAGLMISNNHDFKVLEFNCRLGDPEAQVLLMRLQSDLVDLCATALDTKLNTQQLVWDPRPALGVVMASKGYPEAYEKGKLINGLDNILPDCKVFQAGATLQNDHVITNGGRVLCACALAETIKAAQELAYKQVEKIIFEGAFFRKDIGHRAI